MIHIVILSATNENRLSTKMKEKSESGGGGFFLRKLEQSKYC